MKFQNPFISDTESYQRDISVLKHAIDDYAKFISIQTGDDYKKCRAFVSNLIKTKPEGFKFNDPIVNYTERQENGDRVQKKIKLSGYLGSSIKNNELIAPTLTTYLNPEIKRSHLVKYVEDNIAKRDKAKHAKFIAKMSGDEDTSIKKDIEQKNAKISNNSLSGAHASSSTPLYNKTAHSTLTSTCRSTSAYGNANNEKILSGNRHYWSSDVVINNIISIVNHTDYDSLSNVMLKYGIRYPSVDETMDCIKYSTELYWRSKKELAKVKRLVSKLSSIERAAFVYVGDLYHLAKYNDLVVRDFISNLSKKVTGKQAEPTKIMKAMNGDYKALVLQICSDESRGIKLEDMEKQDPIPDDYHTFASTGVNVFKTLDKYRDFISVFFVSPNVPSSVSHFPESIRRSALTSDTDSTIFTVQDWVKWSLGGYIYSSEARAVAATMIFLASQTITHILAKMSANFGVERDRIYQIQMKNEFMFDVFVPTSVSKHYYAIISCQEGNVYKKHDTEIKGVHLKSSNAPKSIMKQAKEMMEDICFTVIRGEKISIMKYMKQVADIERYIIKAIEEGSPEFFRLGQIKFAKSYKAKPESSPYGHFLMWNETFGHKYGMVEEPPYNVIKISTNLNNPTDISNWLKSIEDQDLAERLKIWIIKNNKTSLKTLLLPRAITGLRGIPKEIVPVLGVRKIILDCTRVFYLILETLGIYMLDKRISKLVSDFY